MLKINRKYKTYDFSWLEHEVCHRRFFYLQIDFIGLFFREYTIIQFLASRKITTLQKKKSIFNNKQTYYVYPYWK